MTATMSDCPCVSMNSRTAPRNCLAICSAEGCGGGGVAIEGRKISRRRARSHYRVPRVLFDAPPPPPRVFAPKSNGFGKIAGAPRGSRRAPRR